MSSTPFMFAHTSDFLRPVRARWPAIFQIWLPVLLFASIFAIESTAAFGADRTSAPLHGIFQSIFGTALDRHWSFTHHLLRKSGHFAGYGILSLFCFRAFRLTLRIQDVPLRRRFSRQWAIRALAVAATFLVAGADEFHQSFLPNRNGCFSDVLLDTAGALTLQLALFLAIAVPAWRNRHSYEAQAETQQPLVFAA